MNKKNLIYIRPSLGGNIDSDELDSIKNRFKSIGYSGIVFVDKSLETAGTTDRIFAAIENMQCSAITVYDLTHLSDIVDSSDEFFRFLAALSKRNVRFYSIAESIDTQQTADKFLENLMRGLHEAKQELKIRRIHSKLLSAKRRGVHLGRPKKADDQKIYELREQGLSLNQISSLLEISRGAVQYSIRRSTQTKV